MGELLDKLRAYLETTEGKESAKRFSDTLNFYHNVHIPKWVNKFKETVDSIGEDTLIELLLNKYTNSDYISRENRCGYYDPRETLLWYLMNYARIHCDECHDDVHITPFTTEMYYVGSYVIQTIIGQGSAILINKRHKL